MELKIWDIFRYVFKWKFLIMLTTILTFLAARFYANSAQTYSAEVVIGYTDPNVAHGLTPDDEEFDVFEIISPTVVASAIEDLELKTSVEQVRRSVAIDPIIPADIVALKESKSKAGEEYTYHPTEFAVRYTVGSMYSGAYARDMLDAIMKNYFIFYSEKYLTQSTLPKIDYHAKIGEHDYFEIADSMNSKITDFISYLDHRVAENGNYRSPVTGKTFADLRSEYYIIKNNDIPALFSYVLGGKITLDKETLLKKYHYKINNLEILSRSRDEETRIAYDLMLLYAENNRSIQHHYSPNEEGQIHESYFSRYLEPDKATYDSLVDNYVKAGVNADWLRIDLAYYQSIIDIFNDDHILFEGQEEMTEKAKAIISEVDSKLTSLYHEADETIRGYNEYLASTYIDSLSSSNIIWSSSVRIYSLLGLILGAGAGMIFAIAYEIIVAIRKKHHPQRS